MNDEIGRKIAHEITQLDSTLERIALALESLAIRHGQTSYAIQLEEDRARVKLIPEFDAFNAR